MLGSSGGGPNWHQPTQRSPSSTSTWWTGPGITGRRFASRFPSRVCPAPTPSGWNPMHQHPPHTPLLASTSVAKSSQVSGVSIRVVNVMPSVWPSGLTLFGGPGGSGGQAVEEDRECAGADFGVGLDGGGAG